MEIRPKLVGQKFYKILIRVLIVQGRHNHVPPMTSNNGDCISNKMDIIIEKGVLDATTLIFFMYRYINTICLKLI